MRRSPAAASTHDRLLPLASPHLAEALLQARRAGDHPSEGMAQLAYVRYLRAARDTQQNCLALIEAVGQTALTHGDLLLLGQACGARADESAFRGQAGAARLCQRARCVGLSRRPRAGYLGTARTPSGKRMAHLEGQPRYV